jgi:hypothetical protein
MLSRLVSTVLTVSLLAAPAATRGGAPPPVIGTEAPASPSQAAARSFATPPGLPAAPPVEAPEIRLPDPAPMPPEIYVDRAEVRRVLAANRAKAIKLFRAYYKRGIYPHNTFTDGSLNVWLDADGRLCAAATIIAGWSADHRVLVLEQAEVDNFIRLVDVGDGWLMDWMLASGLTQEELVAIQLPFVPVGREPGTGEPPDPRLARRADKKLRAAYAEIDRMLVKQGRARLELAVDRLMANPELAARLVNAANS